jgi:dUTP pyrophosphatase
MIKIGFKRLLPEAILPTKAHVLDAGFDFYAIEDVSISPDFTAICRTGIAWDPMDDLHKCYYLQMKSRSGMAFRRGIECTNAGVIDHGYRGEIMIKLYNNGCEQFEIKAGDRIAQGIVHVIPTCECVEIKDISSSDRGNKGFGSTGS